MKPTFFALAAVVSLACRAAQPSEATVPSFLALGDSYTIGQSVDASDRWPQQLVKSLHAKGVTLGDPRIIARTGWTTADLDHAIDEAAPRGPFALVTLQIGVNDQYRGGNAADYRPRFVALLKRAIGFAGGVAQRVVVVSIPDWGATPYAEGRDRVKIGREIEQFNDVNRQEAERAGAHWVDVTVISRRAGEERALIAGDGLHPSAKMYAQWVEVITPKAMAALKSKESGATEAKSFGTPRRSRG